MTKMEPSTRSTASCSSGARRMARSGCGRVHPGRVERVPGAERDPRQHEGAAPREPARELLDERPRLDRGEEEHLPARPDAERAVEEQVGVGRDARVGRGHRASMARAGRSDAYDRCRALCSAEPSPRPRRGRRAGRARGRRRAGRHDAAAARPPAPVRRADVVPGPRRLGREPRARLVAGARVVGVAAPHPGGLRRRRRRAPGYADVGARPAPSRAAWSATRTRPGPTATRTRSCSGHRESSCSPRRARADRRSGPCGSGARPRSAATATCAPTSAPACAPGR